MSLILLFNYQNPVALLGVTSSDTLVQGTGHLFSPLSGESSSTTSISGSLVSFFVKPSTGATNLRGVTRTDNKLRSSTGSPMGTSPRVDDRDELVAKVDDRDTLETEGRVSTVVVLKGEVSDK